MASLVKQQSSGLRQALQTGIAKRLRQTYEALTTEEIPSRQRDLLRQLERREQSKRRGRKNGGAMAERHF